jgi:hypothetical protein
MDASEIKQVAVVLNSDAEAKALIGGKKPRRRTTRKSGGGDGTNAMRVQDLGESLNPNAPTEEPITRIEKADAIPVGNETYTSGALMPSGGGRTVDTVQTEPISPLAVGLSITPPTTVMPAVSSPATGGAVTIGGKKGAGEQKSTVNTVPTARILPTKRRLTGAPAATTLRKPKFRIEGGAGNNPGAVNTLVGTASELGLIKSGGAVKQTRRFKARHIKLTVKSSRAAKELRNKVKAKVRSIPISDVRKLLLKKNVIKSSAAEKLPEEMLRNMLRDYMLLHSVD